LNKSCLVLFGFGSRLFGLGNFLALSQTVVAVLTPGCFLTCLVSQRRSKRSTQVPSAMERDRWSSSNESAVPGTGTRRCCASLSPLPVPPLSSARQFSARFDASAFPVIPEVMLSRVQRCTILLARAPVNGRGYSVGQELNRPLLVRRFPPAASSVSCRVIEFMLLSRHSRALSSSLAASGAHTDRFAVKRRSVTAAHDERHRACGFFM
jgi:hypothetical protein